MTIKELVNEQIRSGLKTGLEMIKGTAEREREREREGDVHLLASIHYVLATIEKDYWSSRKLEKNEDKPIKMRDSLCM